jgi:hypothetical protein
MRCCALALLTVLLGTSGAGAAPKKEEVQMTDAGRKATAKALAWLASTQNSDGSWSEGRYPHNPAITAFALLAFLAQGHLPNQGPYAKEVAKGTRFLLSCARADGYLIGTRGGNMYCHGMATLALAELWGMTGDKDVKPVLKKAVELIVKSQTRDRSLNDGGWRYQPIMRGADISVTIMQVMALRAAKNSGLHVPDETMARAIAYVKRCYNPRQGGFAYMPGQSPGFARTAAGVCVLQLTGEYKAKEVPEAVQYLKDHFHDLQHFCYGHYYASHAMHQVGGKEWRDWYARLNAHLLLHQRGDGSWSGLERSGPGPVYQTSVAVIALSVPMNYLPIFQR